MTDPTERKPTRLRMLAAFPLELVQWLCIALLAVVGYTRRAVFWAELSFIRHAYYYGVVRLKRRILGVPAWQQHDLKLGIYPTDPSEVAAMRASQEAAIPVEVRQQGERYEQLRKFVQDPHLLFIAKSTVDALEAHPDNELYARHASIAAAFLVLHDYVEITDRYMPRLEVRSS